MSEKLQCGIRHEVLSFRHPRQATALHENRVDVFCPSFPLYLLALLCDEDLGDLMQVIVFSSSSLDICMEECIFATRYLDVRERCAQFPRDSHKNQ